MKLYEGKIEIRFFFFCSGYCSFWPLFTQKVNWEYMSFLATPYLIFTVSQIQIWEQPGVTAASCYLLLSSSTGVIQLLFSYVSTAVPLVHGTLLNPA